MDKQGFYYTNGDVFVFEQFADFFEAADDSRQWTVPQRFSSMNMVVMLVCYSGTMNMQLNGREFEMVSGQGLVLLPSARIGKVMVSPDLYLRGFGFAVTAMENIFHTYQQTWEEVLSLNDNPLVTLSTAQSKVTGHLYQIARLEQEMVECQYYKPMLRSLTQSLLYMLADIIDKSTNKTILTSTSKEQQFRRFVQLLWSNGGKHRKVSYFANKMYISPKYLSVIVRETSGKTPLQMINSYTANMIAQRLRNTSMSIKEIAHELNFDNESFFGRYVKKHLGHPPGEYRKLTIKYNK